MSTYNSPPVVANGVVYMRTGQGEEVWAFDAASGQPLWHAELDGSVFGAPTIVNGRLYVTSWDRRLHAFALTG